MMLPLLKLPAAHIPLLLLLLLLLLLPQLPGSQLLILLLLPRSLTLSQRWCLPVE